MYSIDCTYYNKKFTSLSALIDDIITSGADPNYEVTKNGKGIGENASDFIVP